VVTSVALTTKEACHRVLSGKSKRAGRGDDEKLRGGLGMGRAGGTLRDAPLRKRSLSNSDTVKILRI